MLNGLECRLEIDPDQPDTTVKLPNDYFTAASLGRAKVWNLRTIHGKIDLAIAPAGFPEGYDQLVLDAQTGRVYATRVEVMIASLADIEHSKRVADKDRAYLQRVGRLEPHSR